MNYGQNIFVNVLVHKNLYTPFFSRKFHKCRICFKISSSEILERTKRELNLFGFAMYFYRTEPYSG